MAHGFSNISSVARRGRKKEHMQETIGSGYRGWKEHAPTRFVQIECSKSFDPKNECFCASNARHTRLHRTAVHKKAFSIFQLSVSLENGGFAARQISSLRGVWSFIYMSTYLNLINLRFAESVFLSFGGGKSSRAGSASEYIENFRRAAT